MLFKVSLLAIFVSGIGWYSMRLKEEYIIPYYKYKKVAYSRFNIALVSYFLSNGGMSDPFGGRIKSQTRFDFVIYLQDGAISTISVMQSLFPVGFLQRRRSSNGSLKWVFVKPNSTDSYKEGVLLLDQHTGEVLSEFLKAFCKLPTKASKADSNYVSITVWHDYLNYSIRQSDGTELEFKTTIE